MPQTHEEKLAQLARGREIKAAKAKAAKERGEKLVYKKKAKAIIGGAANSDSAAANMPLTEENMVKLPTGDPGKIEPADISPDDYIVITRKDQTAVPAPAPVPAPTPAPMKGTGQPEEDALKEEVKRMNDEIALLKNELTKMNNEKKELETNAKRLLKEKNEKLNETADESRRTKQQLRGEEKYKKLAQRIKQDNPLQYIPELDGEGMKRGRIKGGQSVDPYTPDMKGQGKAPTSKIKVNAHPFVGNGKIAQLTSGILA